MINYETILSTFDDKLTLMQWLQKVEQALEGAGLEIVEIHQQSPTTAYFKFVFADGTSVTTPSITLPRGAKGDTGATGATGATGNGIASITKTGSSGLVDTYTILYTNGSTQTFTVTNGAQGEAGQDGQDGADGVGISNIEIGTNGVVTVTLTDETTVNAGNVFILISTGSVTSGTFTASQLANVKLVNSVIYDSDLHFYKYAREGATNIYYTYFDPISQDIGEYTINKTTGVWTKATDKFSAMIEDVETQMTSDGATAGQVPMADGNGGVSWQTPSGGSFDDYISISSSSGTLTNEEYNKITNKDAVIIYTDSSQDFVLHKQKETSTNIFFVQINDFNASTQYYWMSINKSTKQYTISNSSLKIRSTNVSAPAVTLGKVLTADGNGGATWENASGSQLYAHNIIIYRNELSIRVQITFTIINNSNEQFNISRLASYLYTNSLTNNQKMLACYGRAWDSANDYFVNGIYATSASACSFVYSKDDMSTINQAWNISASFIIYDTIVTL